MATEDNGLFKCPCCGTPIDTLIKKGAYSRAARAELAEAFARAICCGAGVNPDQPGSGLRALERNQYLIWEDFVPQADAVLDLIGIEE